MNWELTLLFVALLVSIVAGVFVEKKLQNAADRKRSHGILNVDCSDPADGPYLYLELTVPIAEVADQKQVLFSVNVIPNISQK